MNINARKTRIRSKLSQAKKSRKRSVKSNFSKEKKAVEPKRDFENILTPVEMIDSLSTSNYLNDENIDLILSIPSTTPTIVHNIVAEEVTCGSTQNHPNNQNFTSDNCIIAEDCRNAVPFPPCAGEMDFMPLLEHQTNFGANSAPTDINFSSSLHFKSNPFSFKRELLPQPSLDLTDSPNYPPCFPFSPITPPTQPLPPMDSIKNEPAEEGDPIQSSTVQLFYSHFHQTPQTFNFENFNSSSEVHPSYQYNEVSTCNTSDTFFLNDFIPDGVGDIPPEYDDDTHAYQMLQPPNSDQNNMFVAPKAYDDQHNFGAVAWNGDSQYCGGFDSR